MKKMNRDFYCNFLKHNDTNENWNRYYQQDGAPHYTTAVRAILNEDLQIDGSVAEEPLNDHRILQPLLCATSCFEDR